METKNIYKICSPDCPDLVYIGSTKQKLSIRFSNHKGAFKSWKAGKIKNCPMSREIFENSDIDNVRIELIEVVEDQAFERERYYIDNIDCVNKNKPTRTHKEYREDNKEIISEKSKTWQKINREKYLNYQKEYREKTNKKNDCAICGGIYTSANKAIHEKTKKHIKAMNETKK